MESAALYTIAARYGRRALTICTVSDHIKTGEQTTSQEREQTFGQMVEIALTPPPTSRDPERAPGRTLRLTRRHRSRSSSSRPGRSAGSTSSPVRTK